MVEPPAPTDPPPTYDELVDLLCEVIAQACQTRAGDLDSFALSTYRDGLRVLHRLGRVVIEHEHGRRVIARWAE